jgi:hypothetical protein
MPLSLLYWILMLFYVLFGCWWGYSQPAPGRYGVVGGSILAFLLFLVLGLKLFGGPIQG